MDDISPTVTSMALHHFHLHHGDVIRVKVTATNGAEKTTSATSNGVTVDLTEPRMTQLVDGTDVLHDVEYTVSITLNLFIHATGHVTDMLIASQIRMANITYGRLVSDIGKLVLDVTLVRKLYPRILLI